MKLKRLHLENFGPCILSVLIAVAFYLLFPRFKAPATMKDVLGAVINVGAILVGFLCTVWSILISLENKRVVVQLKGAGYHNILFDYLTAAIRWLFLLVLISTAGLLIDFANQPSWIQVAFSAWLFLLLVSLLSCYRMMRIFSKMLRFDDVTK